MPDDITVRPNLVAAGAARWEAASVDLDSAWAQFRAAILALSTERTWGTDGPGTAFAGSYLQGGGPAQVLFGPTGGQAVVTMVGDVGRGLTESLAQLLDVDRGGAAGIAAIDGG